MRRHLVRCALLLPLAGTLAACGEEPSSNLSYVAGDYLETVEWQRWTRDYTVHVPDGLSPDVPAPLILVYHGGGITAAEMRNHIDLERVADPAGFVTVHLQGVTGFWASQSDTGADRFGVDDVGFTKEVIKRTRNGLNIDRDRVFVVGLSNGGLMVHRLGCELSKEIAGFASVAATMLGSVADGCDPGPTAALFIQGTEDEFFPWEGFDSFFDFGMSAEATVDHWAEVNGCNPTPTTTLLPDLADDNTTIEQRQFDACEADGPLVFYVVQGGGHAWPGTALPLNRTIVGITSLDMDATATIVEFFARVR